MENTIKKGLGFMDDPQLKNNSDVLREVVPSQGDSPSARHLGPADKPQDYSPLNIRLALQLAAPHTWPAAILPVLFATALAAVSTHAVSVTLVLALLLICILMQASVNTINDYYDFMKGTDTQDNQDDPTDAVLVYNRVNPRLVLYLALGFLGIAFVLGGYVIFCSGWIPLVIGFAGAVIILLYSAGKSPISYLPIGELVSGITMGALIPLACFQALTGIFDWQVLLLALPFILGIGLIMLTNNTCDIEKDIVAGRKTLSVLLKRKRARCAYHGILFFWIAAIVTLVAFFFTKGLIVMPFMVLICYPVLQGLLKNPLTVNTRGAAMPQCLNINIALGTFYVAAILFSSGITVLL
ncbi:MAG: prenyltransferase [Raoultibacter sp.]